MTDALAAVHDDLRHLIRDAERPDWTGPTSPATRVRRVWR
jgi:hypothetical protein